MLKKIFYCILAMSILTIIPVTTYAKENVPSTVSIEYVNKTVTITDDNELQEYCEQKQIPYIQNGKKISKIVIIDKVENDNDTTLKKQSNMSPNAFGDVYQEVYPIYWTDSNVCAMSSGTGPGNLGLSTSYTESATVSASFSYSASDLSAAVGFSVTSSYTISPSYSTNLSSGQSATIYAYPIYAGSLFSKTNIFTGSVYYGRAYRPIGAEYQVTYY